MGALMVETRSALAEVERILDQAYYYTPTPTKQPRTLDREGALTLAVISTSVLVGIIIGLVVNQPHRTALESFVRN
jgi:hypothetical protein